MSPRAAAATLPLVLAALVPATASAGPYDKDYAAYSRNILPAGQHGSIPIPEGAATQAEMYDALTPKFDQVGADDLLSDFKFAGFGLGPDGPGTKEPLPRNDVTITRDRFSVPHVRARTYDGGIWAAGWIAAQDRGLLLEQARYNARVAVIDAPGVEALDLISGLRSFVPSAQTEAIVARQTKVLRRAGRKGRKVLRDIDTFVSGINAYFEATDSPNKPWTRNDVYSLEALKGQFVGEGGGDEGRNTSFYASLVAAFGQEKAYSILDDVRQVDDPEMPASIDAVFPYEQPSGSTAGNVIIDPGSYEAVSVDPKEEATAGRRAVLASNVLMIGAKRSATGRPLMVGGPQIGYFYPGLVYEIDMHAPGLVWRGATSAPFPGYMLIGRGPDFAITLTSAGADIQDMYAETLCGGSDSKYLFKGRCRDMTVVNAGKLDGAPVSFLQTVHGPVYAYATAGGKRVAISLKRSSYGRDALDLLLYRDISTGVVKSPESFFKAAAQSPQTFNSFYVDNEHIAVYTSGRLPIRPKSVDPTLLANGNGKYEWRGFLDADAHPHQTDPKSGRIVNWNNNIARGFGASDSDWSRAGATTRVDLLNGNLDRLAAAGKHDLASVTAAMNAGATQDMRAFRWVPLLERLMAGTTPPSARAKAMYDQMVAWNRAGSSRLDVDLDGRIDHPGAAVLDGAWDRIADAFMAPVLGPTLAEFAVLETRHSHDQFKGWWAYFDKDVRRLLGDTVKGAFTNRYCGAGDKAKCQADIWAAIDAAGAEIAAAQGTDDVAAWRADATAERIEFVPGLLPTTIRWTNRPSGIQQVISFDGHR